MEEVFVRFCTFGAGTVVGPNPPTMDNARFAKMARDCGLLNKRLTAMAQYESRLTDVSLYTGSHKERFDSEGRGRGKEGREEKTRVDLSEITRPNVVQGAIPTQTAAAAIQQYVTHATPRSEETARNISTPSSSRSNSNTPRSQQRPMSASAAVPSSSPFSSRSPAPASSSSSFLSPSPAAAAPPLQGIAFSSRLPENMEDLFVQFCMFGNRDMTQAMAPLMDGARFAKFTRDCGLLDRHLTPGEADIIFHKVKPRTERRINFDQFMSACELIAVKKFGDSSDALTRLIGVCLSSDGPIAIGTSPSYSGHLTDVSLYTGAHKERFDRDGRGKGKEGREQNTGGITDLSQITRPNLGVH